MPDPDQRGTCDLPPLVDCGNVKQFLKEAQSHSREFMAIMEQKSMELDPEQHAKRRTGVSKPKKPMNPHEASQYRLCPTDGVLEHEVSLHIKVLFVPCVPDV